jgi:hypothetical protein
MNSHTDETISYLFDRIEERGIYLNGEDRDMLAESFKFELQWLLFNSTRTPEAIDEIERWAAEERRKLDNE